MNYKGFAQAALLLFLGAVWLQGCLVSTILLRWPVLQ